MLKILRYTTLILAVVALAPSAASGRAVKQPLRPTGVDPDAHGVAIASIHAKRNRGKFRVKARNLKPGTTYGISVAGIRIGSLATSAAGSGAARFTHPRHGSDQFLGVDPRGKKVEVSDDHGEDVLENEMPDDDDDQGKVQCCLSEDDEDEDEAEVECEQTTADECTEEGGTNMGTGTCFPNPCPTTPPAPDIRCCQPDDDDDGPECEEESAGECSASGGVNMGAGSCEPNPCAPTPPGIVTCCVAEHEDDEGEDEDEGEHQPEPPECERLTTAHCAEEGGTVSSAASCEPNPCVSSPSGAFLN